MRTRILTLPKQRSFFLFGARNTGKSTLIQTQFSSKYSFTIDLLDAEQEDHFKDNPSEFYNIVNALPKNVTHVVIDEVQKVPKLLDSVQRLMKDKKRYFIMTGSSASAKDLEGIKVFPWQLGLKEIFEASSVS